MTDRTAVLDDGAHSNAATAFIEQAMARFGEEIVDLYVFGSTAREDARGLDSDVDVLIVLTDGPNIEPLADSLHDIAYDVMLEYGPVVELHILTETEFEESRKRGNPFLETAVHEGQSHV